MKVRKRLKEKEAVYLGLEPRLKKDGRNPIYRITKDQFLLLEDYRNKGINDSCERLEVDPTTVKHLWKKTKKESIFIKNPFYISPEDLDKKIESLNFHSVYKDVVKPIKVNSQFENVGLFDRAVFTDVHIGMNPNPDGFSLYGGVWNEQEFYRRIDIFANLIIANKKSKYLYIDELGDYMDGWDGETTRKGHKLPQNMDNQKAFDVGVNGKRRLTKALVNHFDVIVFNNICEDNHAGSFGYVVNSAFKSIIELEYPKKVKVNNLRHFINHYSVNNYTFILTHGKDSKNLKFGFKPILDHKQEQKISNYIDENFLYKKDVTIEFSKGDSHQYITDYSTSAKFNYCNYPAFSPSSEWVQTNFQKGVSGFVFFNYYKDRKTTHDYTFKWERKPKARLQRVN